MALFIANYSSAQTAQVVVSAVPDGIIRVQRLIVTGWAGFYLALLSDPGGGGEQEITSRLRIQNAAVGVFDFSAGFALNVERGKALGLTTVYQGAPADYGVMIWYEILK